MATLDDIQGVYSTSELRTMCESGRLIFNTAADRLAIVSAELNILLRHVPGNPVLLGLDSRAVARRVTRHLVRASELQSAAARSMKDCWFAYESLVLNPSTSGAVKRFDIKG
ncbi:MAG: hypothetical protein HOV83_07195 [Catenulispora sp.]|nr:hypothetical protein [Catenulispora sp.]